MFAHLHEIRSQYMMKKNQERIGGEDDKERSENFISGIEALAIV